MEKWSCEKVKAWYAEKGRVTGCNFIPSDCISGIEIWQEYGFDEKLKTIDRELGLAENIGMTGVRMVMPYQVWLLQHDGFMERMERFLQVADSHHITLMPVLFDDCCMPRPKKPVKVRFGPQPEPTPGCHGGFPATPFDGKAETGYILGDDRENWPDIERYVKDLVETFGRDERILLWDIWNEPGNSNRGSMSLELMTKAFGWAREMEQVQPLTAGAWSFPDGWVNFGENDTIQEIEKAALELSDVISYHYYGDLERSKRVTEYMGRYGRPLFITEWLHRIFHNRVEELLPYFAAENISCYNWGLVAGKTQTYEPWEVLRHVEGIDCSPWQHDLFHADLTPYDEMEIEVFKRYQDTK